MLSLSATVFNKSFETVWNCDANSSTRFQLDSLSPDILKYLDLEGASKSTIARYYTFMKIFIATHINKIICDNLRSNDPIYDNILNYSRHALSNPVYNPMVQ
jgi:hypothetical protein